jgi:hypothetical protein
VATDTTGGYCPEHKLHYPRLQQCAECRRARAGAAVSGSPKADTRELELREQEYREADKYLRRVAREWLDDGTAQERNVALKAFDAAAKYARLALEIRTSRLEIEHDQWLVEQKRKLSGGGT